MGGGGRGRGLGPVVAAISYSSSASSAWTLLSVSGMAYLWGLPALWLFPATLGGFLINWVFVAPRLRRESAANGSITLSVPSGGGGTSTSRRLKLRRMGTLTITSTWR